MPRRRRNPQPNAGYGRLGDRSPQRTTERLGVNGAGPGFRTGSRRRMTDGQGAWSGRIRKPGRNFLDRDFNPLGMEPGNRLPPVMGGRPRRPGDNFLDRDFRPMPLRRPPAAGELTPLPPGYQAPGANDGISLRSGPDGTEGIIPQRPGDRFLDRPFRPMPLDPNDRPRGDGAQNRPGTGNRRYDRFENFATNGMGLNPAQIEWLKRRVLQRPENLQGSREGQWFQRQIGERVAQAGGIDRFIEDLDQFDRWRQLSKRDPQPAPNPNGPGAPPGGSTESGTTPLPEGYTAPPARPDDISLRSGGGAQLDRDEQVRRLSRIDLPPQLMPAMAQLEDELAAELAQVGVARSQIPAMVALFTQRLASQEGLDRGSLDESMASRGIYTSGIRTSELGNLLNQYNRQRQDFAFDTAGQYSDLAARESNARMNYNRGLADLAREAARIFANDRYSPYGGGSGRRRRR